MTQPVAIKRALVSVSNKTGLSELAKALTDVEATLLSTGGTAQFLKDNGFDVTDVSEVTGFPEIMDGRVKTLHPMVHGGLLAKRDEASHTQAMQEHGIEPIDLLVVNLYPFESAVQGGVDYAKAIENIDIGGPAMLRAAAKNHTWLSVLTDPEDYAEFITHLTERKGSIDYAMRQKLAGKTFARTAAYDSAISRWFAGQIGEWPAYFAQSQQSQTLRYGENPHQQAAVYKDHAPQCSVVHAQQLQGKELSYNNIHDTDAALRLIREFEAPAAALIKHTNPCGVAACENVTHAFTKALACDPKSAFGGILAVNQPVTAELVEAIGSLFLEVIIAPSVAEDAKALLSKKSNLRVLQTGEFAQAQAQAWDVKSIVGGYLVQERNQAVQDRDTWKCVTNVTPSEAQVQDLLFANAVCKHVKSNAIVLALGGASIGIGAGQMSRVDAMEVAIRKAKEIDADLSQAVLASDAFFPFNDNIELAAQAGIKAIIQPGGSKRDEEVIAAADKHGLAMIFTGIRHFSH